MKSRQLLWLVCMVWVVGCSTAVSPTPTPFPPPNPAGTDGMISYFEMLMADGVPLEYGVVLPNDFVDGETYPVLLAFPPGPQTRAMVAAGNSYWGATAQARGWVVVSPVAPGGTLFFQGSEQYLPEFLQRIAAIYPPEGGKFHLVGVSNGGISAFRIATLMPEMFASLTAVPGFPQTADFKRLSTLTEIPVTLFVGENDSSWVEQMQTTEAELRRLGGQVSLTIVPNEGHVIQSLSGAELYDLLDFYRGSR